MDGKKLHKDGLQTAESVLGLGLVVVKELQERGIVTVFLNDYGEVEICPQGEYLLDARPEEEALDTLLANNYSDAQLAAYINGRIARARLSHGTNL